MKKLLSRPQFFTPNWWGSHSEKNATIEKGIRQNDEGRSGFMKRKLTALMLAVLMVTAALAPVMSTEAAMRLNVTSVRLLK